MNQTLFQESCRALWGTQFQSQASRQLGIGLSSVQRYDYGQRDVPDAVLQALAALLADRQHAIEALRKQLPRPKRKVAS